jgi:hypothetical protein
MEYLAFGDVLIFVQLLVLLTDFQGSYIQVPLAESRLSSYGEVANSCKENQLNDFRS